MTLQDRLILRVCLVPPLARRGMHALLNSFHSWEALLEATPEERSDRSGVRLELCQAILSDNDPKVSETLKRLEQCQARIISLVDDAYPPSLKQLTSPPSVLFVRGRLPSDDKSLAVVGARRATRGTRDFVRKLSAELAGQDVTIISGLARGIDTAAHEGAVNAEGCTVAVLGCGIDHIYPQENRQLADQILERGAILSEYPPGVPPLPHHFPARNRIISGLSKGVLVGEASRDSGSLITADFALEQGRDVFALPGLAYSELSAGSNDLLKQGAQPVTEAEDILSSLWPHCANREMRQIASHIEKTLTGNALQIYQQLGPSPCHIDEITRQSGLTPCEVSATLLDLELQGGIDQLPGMFYLRRI